MLHSSCRAPVQAPVRGRMSFSSAPVRRVVKSAFRRIPKVAGFTVASWRPSFGKVGSSFSLLVVNPLRGPPA